MPNKSIKRRCLALLVMREMRIKPTVRHRLTVREMARLGKSDEKQLWVRTQRNQELQYCWVGGGEGAGEWHSHFGKQVCRFLIVQTQSYLEARNPEILPLGGYAKEFKQVC